MLGVLNPEQIETMLNGEVIGRIGCYADSKIYVVPINYAYDGKYIYAHSKEGLKTKMMKENPNVCFEIDRYETSGDWKSVILYGRYEEIKSIRSQRSAMKIFTAQMARLIPNFKAMPSHGIATGTGKENDPFKSVVFRILVTEKSGRFEIK